MEIASYVNDQLREAGHAVESVVIPTVGDRSTWRVKLTAGATPEQQAAADAALAALVVDPAQVREQGIAERLAATDYQVIVIWLAQKFEMEPEAIAAELLAIAKTLP